MANRFNLQYLFQLLGNSVVERQVTDKLNGACGETFWNEAIIPANATGLDAVTMGVGSLTNPKMLIILGGPGVTYAYNSEVTQKKADPIAVESCSAGIAIQANTLVIENSETQPRTVVVIAVE